MTILAMHKMLTSCQNKAWHQSLFEQCAKTYFLPKTKWDIDVYSGNAWNTYVLSKQSEIPMTILRTKNLTTCQNMKTAVSIVLRTFHSLSTSNLSFASPSTSPSSLSSTHCGLPFIICQKNLKHWKKNKAHQNTTIYNNSYTRECTKKNPREA